MEAEVACAVWRTRLLKICLKYRRQPQMAVISCMSLAEAVALFRRLGVNFDTVSKRDFSTSYFALARRYHPDHNPRGTELMANINAARTAILHSYREQRLDG